MLTIWEKKIIADYNQALYYQSFSMHIFFFNT